MTTLTAVKMFSVTCMVMFVYEYSKCLLKHRASDDDYDDDDGSCTDEFSSSSDSSSEVESETEMRSDESFLSDDLTFSYMYM